jgi:CDP-diacylglycerol--serine O-phosphatidyltransferase
MNHDHDPQSARIYLLPNLMTAGNLFCGFAAVLNILDAVIQINAGLDPAGKIYTAVWFILGACVFDLLDGRLARLGGNESAFGREFDSLADIVSFGVAPALLTFHIVLRDFDRYGMLIAFVYLACGALRLARFNCIAAQKGEDAAHKDFEGFPIPAAAGLIASLTLFMLWLDADRMGWLLPTMDKEKLDLQRDVVKNEKRSSYDNQPYGSAYIELFALAYPKGHPYHHPTIGSMEDLDAASLEDVRSFFTT